NLALGWQPDQRDYGVAAHILRTLGVRSIRLLTNNPDKLRQLAKHGVIITERVPLIIETNEHNEEYLETKARKTGHLLGDKASIVDISELISHSDESTGS
ncbi:MAG: hypothetical protein ACW98Y_13170, partial [Candidatus Thorarchaeota archaeon]